MRLSPDTLRRLVAEGRLPADALPGKTGKIAGSGKKRKAPPVCPVNPNVEPKLETVPGGIRITFPFPLPKRNTTQSKNWKAAHDRSRRAKKAALSCLTVLRPPSFTTPVRLIYTVFTPHCRDAGNGDEKYFTDALTAHGVLGDDDREHVVSVELRSEKGEARTELLILEAGHARA